MEHHSHSVLADLELAADVRLCKGGVEKAGRTAVHGLLGIARADGGHRVGVHNAALCMGTPTSAGRVAAFISSPQACCR